MNKLPAVCRANAIKPLLFDASYGSQSAIIEVDNSSIVDSNANISDSHVTLGDSSIIACLL